MIKANDFKRQWVHFKDKLHTAFSEVGESGWYILGQNVKNFEKNLASYFDIKHAIGCANGLDAIHLALKACGLKEGEKVLTTPPSAFATTLAIIQAGGIPVFVDVDELGLVDLNQAQEIIEKEKIKYFIPVHLFGFSLNLEKLNDLKRKYDLFIIEDCAQSIGASYNGKLTGSVGDLAATSFYPTKNLGAFGDGGAVLTQSTKYYEYVCALRDYGQSSKYVHDYIGMNSRLDELHACILDKVFLPELNSLTEKRAQVAHEYINHIKNPEIKIPARALDPTNKPAWHLFPVLVKSTQRQQFMQYLKSSGIENGIHYPILIPQQKAMTQFISQSTHYKIATQYAESEVSLPINPFLKPSEVAQVIDICNHWKYS